MGYWHSQKWGTNLWRKSVDESLDFDSGSLLSFVSFYCNLIINLAPGIKISYVFIDTKNTTTKSNLECCAVLPFHHSNKPVLWRAFSFIRITIRSTYTTISRSCWCKSHLIWINGLLPCAYHHRNSIRLLGPIVPSLVGGTSLKVALIVKIFFHFENSILVFINLQFCKIYYFI